MMKTGGTRGDIDSIRMALRPRMSTGGGVIVQPPPTTVPPHTHSADQITAEPETVTALLAGTNVQADLEELGAEKLARSGEQTMLGALDMNHNSISNIHDADVEGTATVAEDLTFMGAAGLARITSPRVITMAGDHADDEGKVANLNRLVFNAEPTAASIENPSRVALNAAVTAGVDYTPAVGVLSWDAVEGTLVVYVESGA
jgi:hypothetical protein